MNIDLTNRDKSTLKTLVKIEIARLKDRIEYYDTRADIFDLKDNLIKNKKYYEGLLKRI